MTWLRLLVKIFTLWPGSRHASGSSEARCPVASTFLFGWLDEIPRVGLARLIDDQAGAPAAANGARPLMRFSVEQTSDVTGPANAETHDP